MRKITLLLSLVVCALISQAQTLLTEDFNYTAGTGLIGQGGWAIVGTSTFNPITVSASSITYPGYLSSGIGQEVSVNTTGQDVTRAFTAQKSGSVYYSFIVNIQTAKSTYRGDYFIHVVETGSTTALFGRVYVKSVGSKLAFGVLNASGGTYAPTYTDALYDLNTTYLIVVKVNAATAASSLIINPTLGTEPTSNWLSNTTGGTAVPSATAGLGGINIRQGTDSIAPTLKLDGIRVATSWDGLFSTSSAVHTVSANPFKAIVKDGKLFLSNVAENAKVEIFNAQGAKVQEAVVVNGEVVLSKAVKGLAIIRADGRSQKITL